MIQYIIRRLLYAIPILIGVNLLTFLLFFVVNSPDDMARMQLGQKHVTQEAVEKWKHERGYDLPLFWNGQAQGADKLAETIFYRKSVNLMVFRFGQSDTGRNIASDIQERMWPSLAISVPSVVIGVTFNIALALLVVFFRQTYLEFWGLVLCVMLMSVSSLFYIIGGQYVAAKLLQLVPISGYSEGWGAIKFLLLPVSIGVASGIGSGVRWYRALFLEEVEKDYVRTARAKGLSEAAVLFRHVLRNAMIPILTGVVVLIPFLFMGSLLTESFFSIPGWAAIPSTPSIARISPSSAPWFTWARCCTWPACC